MNDIISALQVCSESDLIFLYFIDPALSLTVYNVMRYGNTRIRTTSAGYSVPNPDFLQFNIANRVRINPVSSPEVNYSKIRRQWSLLVPKNLLDL